MTTPDALKLAAQLRAHDDARLYREADELMAEAAALLEQQHAALESLRSKVTAYEVHCAAVEAEVESLRAGRAVPGWQLVPVEPTPEMLESGLRRKALAIWKDGASVLRASTANLRPSQEVAALQWRAMLSAAPTPPQAEQAHPRDVLLKGFNERDQTRKVQAVDLLLEQGYRWTRQEGWQAGKGVAAIHPSWLEYWSFKECERLARIWTAGIDLTKSDDHKDDLGPQWKVVMAIMLARLTHPATRPDDARRLDAIRDNSWKLDPFDMPTGGDDYDIGWRVVQYHMGKPTERVVAEVYEDNPRAAIDVALSAHEQKGGAA